MLTEEQKREFENLFNFYSLRKEFDSKSRTEMITKMASLKSAVSILGYRFMADKTEEGFGVTYTCYTLQEITR